MKHHASGQHCGLAHAMEVLGEPWAMLLIRDLFVEPKTLSGFRRGFPQTPAEVLVTRIEELERAGVIQRGVPRAPTDSSVFELTEYGAELEEIVVSLSRWGLRTLGPLRRDEIMTEDSLITALRATFRPEAARGVHMNFVVEFGDIVVHTCVTDGQAEIGKGYALNPDLIIEAGPPLQLLLKGETSPREALESAGVRLRSADGGPGNPGLLMWFVELFRIPPAPLRTSVDGRVPSMRPRTPSPQVLAQHVLPNGTRHSASISE